MSEAFYTLLSIPDDDETPTFLRHLFRKAQVAVEDASSEAELLEKARSRPSIWSSSGPEQPRSPRPLRNFAGA